MRTKNNLMENDIRAKNLPNLFNSRSLGFRPMILSSSGSPFLSISVRNK